jgi:hypothetical protein
MVHQGYNNSIVTLRFVTTEKDAINDSPQSILLDKIEEMKKHPEGTSRHERKALRKELQELIGDPNSRGDIAKLVAAWPEVLIPMVVSCLHDEKNQHLKREVLLNIFLAPAPTTAERRYQEIRVVEAATFIDPPIDGLAMIADAVKSCHARSIEEKKQLAEIADAVRSAILQDLPGFKDQPEKAVQALMAYEEILYLLPGGAYSLKLEEALRSRYAIVVRNYEEVLRNDKNALQIEYLQQLHDWMPADSRAHEITNIEQLTSEKYDDRAKCFALLCQPQFDGGLASLTKVAKSMFGKHAAFVMQIRDHIRNQKLDTAESLLYALRQSPDLSEASTMFIDAAEESLISHEKTPQDEYLQHLHDLMPAESKAREITTIEQLASEEHDDRAKCFALLCQPLDGDLKSDSKVAKTMFGNRTSDIMRIRYLIRNQKLVAAKRLLHALQQSPQSQSFIDAAKDVLKLIRPNLKPKQNQPDRQLPDWYLIALGRQV